MIFCKKLVQSALCAGIVSGFVLGGAAWAQGAYPTRTIKVVVPFLAGGATDQVGRMLSQRLSEELGQSVVVENIPGASTMIAAERVAKSAPDGYTLLIGTSTTFASNPNLFKTMSYSLDDFVGISMVAKSPLILAVAPNTPYNTLKEFIAYAKLRPGKISYGTTGRGGNAHVVGELASGAMGIKMNDVPYKGSSAAVADLMGGHIPVLFDGVVNTLPLYNTGKIKILAITTEERAESAPNVPTFAELGYPDVVAATLIGLLAPAKTPRDIVMKLNAAMKKVLENPEFRAILRPDATVPNWTTPEQLTEMYKANREQMGKVIKTMDIEMQ